MINHGISVSLWSLCTKKWEVGQFFSSPLPFFIKITPLYLEQIILKEESWLNCVSSSHEWISFTLYEKKIIIKHTELQYTASDLINDT